MESEKRKLKALSDIASVDITLEFNEILQNILKITCEAMNVHSGTIMLVDERRGELRMVASYGLPPDYIDRVYDAAKKAGVPITSSPSGTVLNTGKYYLVPNIFEEPRDKPWYDLSRQLGFSAQIFTPMKRGPKITGLLNIYMAEPHGFTDYEIDFVTVAASQAASVVQNAGMCSRLKDNVRELQGFREHLEEKIEEAHKKLYESEAKYRDLFENANDSLYIYDADGCFKEVNNTVLRLLGCTKEEIIGTHISGWITPESLRISRESLEKHAAGESMGEPVVLEVICKNGEHRWIEVKRRIIKDEDRVKEVHGIARDITERKRLEQELKESEARYRDLFENADEPMFTLSPEGYFLGLNNAGLKILGSTRDELIGSHISDLLTPQSYEIAQVAIKKRIRGEPVEPPSVLELITKRGEHRWVEIRSRVLRDGDRITGIHGIARDITEKKRLEQELIESEARYRDLFEKAEDPMYTLDTTGFFQSINNAGLKSLGCTKDEVIGTHISKWLTPGSLALSLEVLGKQILGISIEYPVILEIICKNGEHRWGEIRTRFIRNGYRITGVHGIARDITEKIRLEQQLNEYHEKLKKSYEELIESDRLRTEFVSNITHELLTPLTSIKGFTELLHDETAGKISSEQKKNLEIILRNSDRLIRLIKDLLDVAHLEKNRFGLQFGLVSVGDILIKSAQDVQPQAKYKGITIVQDIEPLPRLWGDEGRLIQVITNLLTNAIKFTPQGGKITITAKENKSEIKISVADTGIGIPQDKLSRVFDRFYQIDGSASRKFGGTGLGLSICKSIVESHYGTIWAESCDSGSTFHVVLPKLENRKKTGS